jgi:ABC-type glycerol-3-phosphate transport system substrate-binding protein
MDLAEREAILPLHEPEDWNADWAKRVAIFQSEARPAMWVGSLSESIPGDDQMYDQADPFSSMAFRTDGFAPFPVNADNLQAGTTPISPSCISMSAGTNQPRAAWAWIDFLTRQSLVRDENQPWERLQAPARRSVSDQMDYFSVLPEETRAAVRFALEHAWFGSLYPETFASAQSAITKTIQEGMSFAEAVEAAKGELQGGPKPTPDTAEVVVATPLAPPPEDATVINYFYNAWEPRDRENFRAIVETFNADHPDLFVKPSYDIMNPPMNGDLLAWISEQYDCFSWYPSFNPDQPPQGVISLNSLIEAEDPEFIQDFVPEQLDALRIEGALYGIPTVSQPKMIAYNADLLARRGLEPPALDWTFADFVELINAAASTSEDDLSYGFLIDPWENFLYLGRGAEWADLAKDPPEANFLSPDMVSTMAWMTDLIESGALLVQRDDSIESWTTVEQAFREGQVAFWVAQAGQEEGWWFQGLEPEYKVGMAPLPTIDEVSASEILYWDTPQSQFISTQAQDPQACWEWIKFLSEQPGAFPGVPARRSLVASPAWIASVGEDIAAAYRYALEQPQKPDEEIQMSPIGWPFYTWRAQAIEEILKGGDIEKALSGAQGIASDYLACMGAVDASTLDAEQLQSEVNRCARQADPQGDWPEQ